MDIKFTVVDTHNDINVKVLEQMSVVTRMPNCQTPKRDKKKRKRAREREKSVNFVFIMETENGKKGNHCRPVQWIEIKWKFIDDIFDGK